MSTPSALTFLALKATAHFAVVCHPGCCWTNGTGLSGTPQIQTTPGVFDIRFSVIGGSQKGLIFNGGAATPVWSSSVGSSPACTPSADPYVVVQGGVGVLNTVFTVDIWKAFMDGMWSGSTTMVFLDGSPFGGNFTIGTAPRFLPTGSPTPCLTNYSKNFTYPRTSPVTANCPDASRHMCTITFHDDGTWLIA